MNYLSKFIIFLGKLFSTTIQHSYSVTDNYLELMAADFPIFIDTNLDTHLVMTVSALNTVSDLKRNAAHFNTLKGLIIENKSCM